MLIVFNESKAIDIILRILTLRRAIIAQKYNIFFYRELKSPIQSIQVCMCRRAHTKLKTIDCIRSIGISFLFHSIHSDTTNDRKTNVVHEMGGTLISTNW